MRFHLLLPKVKQKNIAVPCVGARCPGKRFRLHQPMKKALRDRVHQHV